MRTKSYHRRRKTRTMPPKRGRLLCFGAVIHILAATSSTILIVGVVGVAGQLQKVKDDGTTTKTSPASNTNVGGASYPYPHMNIWTPREYPDLNDPNGPKICQTSMKSTVKRLCDPNHILKDHERESVEKLLMDHPISLSHPCGNHGSLSSNLENTDMNLQLGVALVSRMNLDEMSEEDPSRAAGTFARHVHDTWGVGEVVSCRSSEARSRTPKDDTVGTGILIFLSQQDRALFITRGAALETVLTDRRLDYVINRVMRPLLQQKQYGQAIEDAILQILAFIKSGEPNTRERIGDWMVEYGGILFVFSIFGFVFWHAKHLDAQKRKYARVASHLNEIEKAKAQALQGKYSAESCPICLEAFQIQKPQHEDTSCKIKTQKDPNTSEVHKQQQHQHDEVVIKGSDGLPVKLLRCGHVFDQTCWQDWINSGNCNIDKCPICKADVGNTGLKIPNPTFRPQQSTGSISATSRPGGLNLLRGPLTRRNTSNNSITDNSDHQNRDDQMMEEPLINQNQQYPPTHHSSSTAFGQRGNVGYALRLYNLERDFRLAQLGRRYPQFIRPNQIQHWTDSTYQGSMVQDPVFRQYDPSRVDASAGRRSGSSGSSNTGFGGGVSGGGRGGRW